MCLMVLKGTFLLFLIINECIEFIYNKYVADNSCPITTKKCIVAIWFLFEGFLLMNQCGDCSGGYDRRINSGSCSMLEAVAEAAVVPHLYMTFGSLEKIFYMTCLNVLISCIKTSKGHYYLRCNSDFSGFKERTL